MHQHTHGAQCEYYGRNRNIYIYEAREEIQKNAHCCFQPFAIKSIRMGAFFYLFKRDHSPLHFLSTLALALEFRSCMYLAEYALSGTAMRSNLHEPTTEGKAHTKKSDCTRRSLKVANSNNWPHVFLITIYRFSVGLHIMCIDVRLSHLHNSLFVITYSTSSKQILFSESLNSLMLAMLTMLTSISHT